MSEATGNLPVRVRLMLKKRDDAVAMLTAVCEALLGIAGWANMTDDELREEALLRNEAAWIILAARSALREVGTR